MGLLVLWAWLPLALVAVTTRTGLANDEAPSWFVYRSDTLEVHVCNVIDRKDQPPTTVSEFSRDKGRMLSRGLNVTTEYHVLPLIFSEEPHDIFEAEVGRKYYKAKKVVVDHINGTPPRWYALAIFEAHFRLKEVTGFRYRGVSLGQESKLQ